MSEYKSKLEIFIQIENLRITFLGIEFTSKIDKVTKKEIK